MYNHLKFKGNESNFFFLSDLHWNHNPNWEIPIWKTRGFNSFEDYNEGLISAWNSVCDENSIVFHLGDLLFNDGEGKKFYQLTDRLRYKELYLLCGNHYSGQKQAYFNALGKVYPGLAQVGHCVFPLTSEINGRNITFLPQYAEVMINRDILILSHYRIYSWNYMAKNSLHLHGHQHLASLESDLGEIRYGKMADIGLETLIKYNGGSPISLSKLKGYMNRKSYKPEGHH
jgi:calcineurin-like phosphoesterase family protein